MTDDKISPADFDYLRNINSRAGPNMGKSIDPTQPGPTADRIAELEDERAQLLQCLEDGPNDKQVRAEIAKRDVELYRLRHIADLEREIAKGERFIADIELDGLTPEPGFAMTMANLRAELSRLSNEQPKGGEYLGWPEAQFVPAPSPAPSPRSQDVRRDRRGDFRMTADDVVEVFTGQQWTRCPDLDFPPANPALVQAAVPQDVRERFARALYFAAEGLGPESWYVPENDAHWERWKNEGQDGITPSPLAIADVLLSAFPALAQSDAQPVGWQARMIDGIDGYEREWMLISKTEFEIKSAYPDRWQVRPLYTTPPALPEGAREGLEAERQAIAAEARRYASHYPQGSDGRNTFILLAEWIEARRATPTSSSAGLIEAAELADAEASDWGYVGYRVLQEFAKKLRARAADRSAT